MQKNENFAKQAEQAEAERPEVVGSLYLGGWADQEELEDNDVELDMKVVERLQVDLASKGDGVHMPLMTVAQHERIVGELRAVIAQLRQHKNDYMDSGQETYRALQNEIREREAEIARLDGLVSGRTAERDAALAEVERLRQFERICEGLPQDAIDGGWTVQGIRCYAKRLEDQLKVALARVAELERKLRDEENAHTTTIEQRDNAEHWADQLAKAIAERFGVDIGEHSNLNCPWNEALVWMQQPPAQAQHSVPDGAADLCRFLAKLYCELDGLRYSTAKLPAEQIADALIFKWPVLQGARNQLNIKRISEQPYDESKLHSAIAAMLAAAPGKEGL
ncbi:hypothetical protein [Pseudomonas aeruginosa]|uniref:hypothetical protein n=1 Tax=Pseudomonas aeruginosa TaxID=287 RepID=UPI001E400558|nr:hypothetical protein [Pseudomonas aeruginosa]MCD2844054.1 hypothetical protein [Pseudomonas aeruginosa]